MLIRITTSAWFEFLGQLGGLMRDPVCYGIGVPRGDGEPILLIPGFTAGDWSLTALATWLRRVGYRPYMSGIDLNVGCPRRTMEVVGWRLEQITKETGRPVTIVGHSLGGVLGRALSVTYPDQVKRVIALGSPLRIHWDAVRDEVRPAMRAMQAFWQRFSDAEEACGTTECGCGFAESLDGVLPDFTSIFTRADEVVDWRECVDEDGRNVEVSGLHCSLIVNRHVYRHLGSILADNPGH